MSTLTHPPFDRSVSGIQRGRNAIEHIHGVAGPTLRIVTNGTDAQIDALRAIEGCRKFSLNGKTLRLVFDTMDDVMAAKEAARRIINN